MRLRQKRAVLRHIATKGIKAKKGEKSGKSEKKSKKK